MNEALTARQNFNIKLLAYCFLYVTFNGVVRKWVLTDSTTNNLLLGLQIGFPIIFAVLARTKPYSRFTYSTLTAYTILLILMAFNPLGKSLFHGIIGFFLHVGLFFPLYIYANDRDAFPVERLNKVFLFALLFETALGLIQFSSPADSFINKYVRDMSEFGGIATLYAVDRVRITGTFSYIGGLYALLIFFGFWLWGLRLIKGSTILIITILVACAVITPMTGSRGVVATLLILLGCTFISTINDLRSSLSVLFLLVAGFYIALQFTDLSLVLEGYIGLNDRIQGHTVDSENENRILGQIREIIDFKGNYPVFGTGLGGTYQGAIALFGESEYLKEYGYYEEEPERIILEGGYLLFFVRFILWFLLFQKLSIPRWYCLIILILEVFFSVTIFNVFTAFYTIVGLIYLDRCYHLRAQLVE